MIKKISIITVVYNGDKTIVESIESVLNQTYNNIEYIIIDGGSKDGTVEIIQSYLNKISVFVSESDRGIYDAMNKGIRLASGDVIGILNSDDVYKDSTILGKVMEYFNTDEQLDILYGDLQYVKSDNLSKVVRNWKSMPYYNNFFEHANVPPHPTLFVHSRVYKEAGVFDVQYRLASDYEFMLRIFKKYTFKSLYINQLIVKMRLGGATNKNIRNIVIGNNEILTAWRKNSLVAPITLLPLKIIKRILQFVNKK
jgi:glycosyltransferase involved in cell wall biosynthesis